MKCIPKARFKAYEFQPEYLKLDPTDPRYMPFNFKEYDAGCGFAIRVCHMLHMIDDGDMIVHDTVKDIVTVMSKEEYDDQYMTVED